MGRGVVLEPGLGFESDSSPVFWDSDLRPVDLRPMDLDLTISDFRFRGLGLELGERGLGLATRGLDYISG